MNNTFIFKKSICSGKAMTREQLQGLHKCFIGLGYCKSYQSFYSDLAEYCEGFVGESASLLSKEAKPFVSAYLLQLLETMTQPKLASKIFALLDKSKQFSVSAKVPAVSVRRQDAIKIVLSAYPGLKGLLSPQFGKKDLIFGFACPVYGETRQLSTPPANMDVASIRIGVIGKHVQEQEIVKIDIIIMLNNRESCEIPLFRKLHNACTVFTKTTPYTGTIFVEDCCFLTMKGYYFYARWTDGYENDSMQKMAAFNTERRKMTDGMLHGYDRVIANRIGTAK